MINECIYLKTLCKDSNNILIMQLFMPKIKPQAIPSGAMIGYMWPYIISIGAINGEGLNPLNCLTNTIYKAIDGRI